MTFEAGSDDPGGTDRLVSITVTDANGVSSAPATRMVEVTPVPDAPILSGLDGDTAATGPGGLVAIDVGADAAVADPDSAHFGGHTLTLARAGGLLAGDFLLLEGGTAAPVPGAGESLALAGTVVGMVAETGRGLRDLVVDLAPTADEAALALLLRSLGYRPEQAGTHAFEAVIAETGGPASAPAAFTVDVVSPPSPPGPGPTGPQPEPEPEPPSVFEPVGPDEGPARMLEILERCRGSTHPRAHSRSAPSNACSPAKPPRGSRSG